MREISALARAGLPLPEGLKALATTNPSDPVSRSVLTIVESLGTGSSLAEALNRADPKPPPHVVALLRCASESGDVATLADAAADSAQRTLKTRNALETLTAYPVTVVAACFAIYGFLLMSILPRNYGSFQTNAMELDGISYLVYLPVIHGFHGGLVWLLMVLAVILLAMVIIPGCRRGLWWMGQRLPGISGLAQIGDFGNMLRTVSTLTGRGVPLPDALRATAPALTTEAVRRAAQSMAEAADKAQPIHVHTPSQLPATLSVVLEQAERQGTFPLATESLGRWCTETFTHMESRAAARLEPVLLMAVGILVALLAHAIYSPVIAAMTRVGVI